MPVLPMSLRAVDAAPSGRSPARRTRGWPAVIAVVLSLLAVAYAALVGALWWRQEALLFQPQPLPAEHRFRVGPDVHEVRIDRPGAVLSALHLKLPAPKGVVFFLHGNGGNLDSWFVNTDVYRQANVDLFMLDYRGYGKSSGRIESEAQLHEDVRAAWNHIAPGYAGRRVVIYGRSLGSALAAHLAASVRPDRLILVSPYQSMQALAAEHYPWVPGFALRYPLRTDAALAHLSAGPARPEVPVLLVHGDRDTLIPIDHSGALLGAAPHASLQVVEGGAHNDLQDFTSYQSLMRDTLKAL